MKKHSIKAVMQEERTGCGIASVAALAGLSYSRAKAAAHALGIEAGDASLWSETGHVRRLLAHFGIRAGAGERPFRSWESLPDLALLAIKWHEEKGRPFWHWVVFVRDSQGPRVLDSKRGLAKPVRTDFGRIKPRWFIRVSGADPANG